MENTTTQGISADKYIVFTDLAGFSKLTPSETQVFAAELIPALYKEIETALVKAQPWNTWGDALFAVFSNPNDAIELMLLYRDFFSTTKILSLKPRIAAHFGDVFCYHDPILNSPSIMGVNVNTPARLEPVTRVGEIFVTEEFQKRAIGVSQPLPNIAFDPIGELEFAKGFGVMEVFRLRRNNEEEQIPEHLFQQKLTEALPDVDDLTKDEKSYLKTCEGADEAKTLNVLLEGLESTFKTGATGVFAMRLAELCKQVGLYKQGEDYARLAGEFPLNADGITVYPLRHDVDRLKTLANCLSKQGKYEEATNIMYDLWQSGKQDSDTLCMLAAQYKRKALFDQENKIQSREQMDRPLLERSYKLYLEAFRRDLDSYYAAINAAYNGVILSGAVKEAGKLAKYIKIVWMKDQGQNWWKDATLAEAEMLEGGYRKSLQWFQKALQAHNPPSFERASTATQIEIFQTAGLHSPEDKEEIQKIIDLLSIKT